MDALNGKSSFTHQLWRNFLYVGRFSFYKEMFWDAPCEIWHNVFSVEPWGNWASFIHLYLTNAIYHPTALQTIIFVFSSSSS